jgi:hypothetical protein
MLGCSIQGPRGVGAAVLGWLLPASLDMEGLESSSLPAGCHTSSVRSCSSDEVEAGYIVSLRSLPAGVAHVDGQQHDVAAEAPLPRISGGADPLPSSPRPELPRPTPGRPCLQRAHLPSRREVMQFCIPSLLKGNLLRRFACSVGAVFQPHTIFFRGKIAFASTVGLSLRDISSHITSFMPMKLIN